VSESGKGTALNRDKNGKPLPATPSPAPLPQLKGIDPKMQELIMNEILDRSPAITFDDIGMNTSFYLVYYICVPKPN
jgi:hypothetical protein